MAPLDTIIDPTGAVTAAASCERPSLLVGQRGRVLKNAMALTLAQAAGYIVPLLLLPYTAVVLGPHVFGVLAIFQAAQMYGTMVVNYGFGYSATRETALHREQPSHLTEIVVNVWSAKVLLTCACLLLGSAAFAAVDQGSHYRLEFVCAFLSLFGTILYPDWFFQGVEEMKWITVVTVSTRLSILPLIFVFVKQPSDLWKLLLLQSLNSLTAGGIGAMLVRGWFGTRLGWPTVAGVRRQFAAAWTPFLSCASLNFSANFNILLLGHFTTATIVGYYSAAQRLVVALQMMWNGISQALYPYFCRAFRVNVAIAAKNLRNVLVLVSIAGWTAAALVSVTAPRVIPRLLGAKYHGAIPIFQILIFLVAASSASNLLGTQGLLGMGFEAKYLRIVATGTVLNVVVASVAVKLTGYVGLAVAVVVLELIFLAREFRFLRAQGAV